MDHHCKFLNNCIGYRNYKYFIVFLFYASVSLIFLLVTMIEGFSFYFHEYTWESINCKLFVAGYIYIFSIFIGVIDLYIYHLSVIFKGVTTIENKENKKDFVRKTLILE